MNKMTIKQLIDKVSHLNPEAEIRVIYEASYPFEYSIVDVYDVQENQVHLQLSHSPVGVVHFKVRQQIEDGFGP
jgi:hypothetical protein